MKIHSAPCSIIGQVLKSIVNSKGSMCLIADDGRLSIYARTSGMDLCEVSGKEAK